MYPQSYRFTKDHEWIDTAGGKTARVGITAHAAEQLGDIVFVQLPKVGTEFKTHQSFGVVESVKAVSDIYMPVAGKVVEVNKDLEKSPETINGDPHGKGWICAVEIGDQAALAGLMTAAQYETLLKG